MRLMAAHGTQFKSVADSGEVEIDEKVTALVGKNESGETAVLQAMYRLNALPSGHVTDFEELRDYPRRYRSWDKTKIAATSPIAMTFLVQDGDRAAVAEGFGPDALTPETVQVSKQYGSDGRVWPNKITERRRS